MPLPMPGIFFSSVVSARFRSDQSAGSVFQRHCLPEAVLASVGQEEGAMAGGGIGCGDADVRLQGGILFFRQAVYLAEVLHPTEDTALFAITQNVAGHPGGEAQLSECGGVGRIGIEGSKYGRRVAFFFPCCVAELVVLFFILFFFADGSDEGLIFFHRLLLLL